MDECGPVAIIGAGIAGLTAALSLARKGFLVDILERAPELSEVGAGLQLSPNATRILQTLGVLPEIEQAWSEPEAVALVSGTSLRPVATVPSGVFARKRWRAPYGVLRRASLQRILAHAVEAQPLCKLHLGASIDDASSEAIDRITGRSPRFIVGADGVWSRTRNRVQGAGKARFSGNIARRFTLSEARAPAILDPSRVTAFVGPGAHLVAYPLAETRSFNVVAITGGADPGESWDHAAHAGDRWPEAFAGWHPQLVAMLKQSEGATMWPLCEVTEGAWHDDDKTVLIGDAAHAMMPFAAQGAAMAIEDAFELASFVSERRADSLAAFAAHRKDRIARVRARAAFNRFAYHARGPVRLARDFVLALRKPEALAADLDWLYGYRPRD